MDTLTESEVDEWSHIQVNHRFFHFMEHFQNRTPEEKQYDGALNRNIVQAIRESSNDNLNKLLKKIKRSQCFISPSIVLLEAVKYGNEEIIKILLKAGVPMGIEDVNDGNEINVAVVMGNVRILQLFELYDTDVSFNLQAGPECLSPLHFVVRWSNMDCAKYLLEKHLVMPNIASSYDGKTPLHFAAINGDLEMVTLLLNYANSLVVDNDNYAPWMYALEYGNMEVVDALLKAHGTDSLTEKRKMAAIHIASMVPKINFIEFLIDKGADVNVISKSGGHTPFSYALLSGNLEVACFLLTYSPDIAVLQPEKENLFEPIKDNKPDPEWQYKVQILNYIVQNGVSLTRLLFSNIQHLPIAKWALDSGAETYNKEVNKDTILMYVVQLICSRITSQRRRDYFLYESTPLDVLIEANVNIAELSAVKSDQGTPLLYALSNQYIIFAQFLLYIGCDTTAAYEWSTSDKAAELWQKPHYKELLSLLHEYHERESQLHTLQESCCRCVRQQLGLGRGNDKVNCLPLPNRLKLLLLTPVSILKDRFTPLKVDTKI